MELQNVVKDLSVADIDGDGNRHVVVAGRAARNVKIYWNKDAAK